MTTRPRPIIPVIVGALEECVVCHEKMIVHPYPKSDNHPGFMHPTCASEFDKENKS